MYLFAIKIFGQHCKCCWWKQKDISSWKRVAGFSLLCQTPGRCPVMHTQSLWASVRSGFRGVFAAGGGGQNYALLHILHMLLFYLRWFREGNLFPICMSIHHLGQVHHGDLPACLHTHITASQTAFLTQPPCHLKHSVKSVYNHI